MGIFQKLFVQCDMFDRISVSATKRKKREEKAVRRAMRIPDIASLLRNRGLGEEDLIALRSRLSASVPEERCSDEAIQNVELLEWFFSLPDRNKLTFEESIQLTYWVRYGRKE